MIRLDAICKSFEGKEILKDFSYDFEDGKVYAITGPSGSGKTTMLNLIAKLEQVDHGRILINEEDLVTIKEKKYFKHNLSYIFQNHGLIDNQTIEENLNLALLDRDLAKKKQKMEKHKVMLETLEKVRLHLDLDRKIFSLSGGEAQRVAVAKAILKDMPILLADEPTASLDRENEEEVIRFILQMKRNDRVIVIATHSLAIAKMADEVIHLGGQE